MRGGQVVKRWGRGMGVGSLQVCMRLTFATETILADGSDDSPCHFDVYANSRTSSCVFILRNS